MHDELHASLQEAAMLMSEKQEIDPPSSNGKKKSEVNSNFTVFINQKKSYFTNTNFDLSH
jgi:hypothetical protein